MYFKHMHIFFSPADAGFKPIPGLSDDTGSNDTVFTNRKTRKERIIWLANCIKDELILDGISSEDVVVPKTREEYYLYLQAGVPEGTIEGLAELKESLAEKENTSPSNGDDGGAALEIPPSQMTLEWAM